MNKNEISPDDPRVTAYALGEMEHAEREVFERELSGSDAARAAVEEIRAASDLLGTALAVEAATESPPAGIADSASAPAPEDPARSALPRVVRFPYFWVAGLAAASFAVAFVVWQSRYGDGENVRLVELPLAPAAPSAPAAKSARGSDGRILEVQLNPNAPENRASDVAAGESATSGSKDDAKPARAEAAVAPVVNVDAVIAGAGLRDQVTAAAPSGSAPEFRGLPALNVPVSSSSTGAPTPVIAIRAGDERSRAAQSGAETRSYADSRAGKMNAEMEGKGETVALAPFQVSGERSGYARYGGLVSAHREFRQFRAPKEESDLVRRFDTTHNTETYDRVVDNAFRQVSQDPLSTFSIDVDTASYSNVRRFLQGGSRPPPDAVRIEELVNYFPYDYAPPPRAGAPFAAAMEIASAPWEPQHRLLRIGLKGREVAVAERGPANLVFLLDVSGSMESPDKLPLVQQSMRMLVGRLRDDDHVAIVVYAGASGLALPSTPVADKRAILDAIDSLQAGGSTNGAMGIQLAYDIAKANFSEKGVNRVILCTDGDFNVGVTNRGNLTRLIETKAKAGVFLTALGFGMGNLKDATLEELADKGNGAYGYVDSAREARKLLVEQVAGTLVTIAKDVKIQVEFNPAQVQAYRLIGYENRALRNEDFNNDKIDAGEIGAGHTVTALYEIVPVGVPWKPESGVDTLKYQKPATLTRAEESSGELLTLKLRYKEPDGDASRLLEFPFRDTGARFDDASPDFKFAAAVASFGMILRDSPYRGAATLADAANWASAGASRDPGGYRSEFLTLLRKAEAVR